MGLGLGAWCVVLDMGRTHLMILLYQDPRRLPCDVKFDLQRSLGIYKELVSIHLRFPVGVGVGMYMAPALCLCVVCDVWCVVCDVCCVVFCCVVLCCAVPLPVPGASPIS